jgi:hypothetical protein
MKQIMLIAGMAMLMAGCNSGDKDKTKTDSGDTKTAAAADVQLPIPLERPYRNWQIGGTENVVAALNGLKAFIDKDFAAMAATIGDSLAVDFDNYQEKMTRDSAINWMKAGRAMYQQLKVNVYDYVSVVSADKSEEWVTLWYKQVWTDAKGVTDSASIINDIQLKNGKMVRLEEKASRFMVKK